MCNIPCVKDKNTICGGTNRTDIREAKGYAQSIRAIGARNTTGSGLSAGPTSETATVIATAKSGVRSSVAVFW